MFSLAVWIYLFMYSFIYLLTHVGFFCLLACFTACYVFMSLGCNLQQVNKVTGGFVWTCLELVGDFSIKKKCCVKEGSSSGQVIPHGNRIQSLL